ncbi:MAG TPA: ABC transporter ATP-binding protein [candidate division Zixibacteria bacterium]|nr:ABC transporter ATP-binding protein [candidate division Zixibacteria bacterium]
MIELIDIHKTFDGKPVLRGVSLELRDGETLVVLGRSGCGKSVTLKIILRLMRPDSGRVIIDGDDTSRHSEERMMPVRKRMGMLFQGSALFDSLSVRENVAYALREHTKMTEAEIEDKVAECLEFVEMNGTQALMPAELSGGMKKRVALARAIALGPAYMFYDEPTTGLDPLTSKKINQLIRRLQSERKASSIVVTHEIANAFQVADRFVVMKDGQILASGTAEEIRGSRVKFVQDFIKGGVIADGKQ